MVKDLEVMFLPDGRPNPTASELSLRDQACPVSDAGFSNARPPHRSAAPDRKAEMPFGTHKVGPAGLE